MKKTDRTLVILSPGFPDSEADTNCLPMQQWFIRTLKDIFPDVHVVVLSFQYPYQKKTYSWFGNTVISFAGKNKGNIMRLMLRREIAGCLKQLYHKHNIIGLLSFWYKECAWVGNRFARLHGLPHYCWILGQDAKKENKYPRLLPPKAGELVALSDFLQMQFEKDHGIKPAHVVPAGIAATQFNSQPVQKNIDILAAGSLITLKRYELFLEIFADIQTQVPGLTAMLVGGGPEKERLASLIKKLRLQNQVQLTGEIPHPELLQLMQRTRIFLHTSSYEGFSGVCLEAVWAGAHVISFQKPMNHDIDQWHIVANPEEMRQKTINLLQSPQVSYKSIRDFKMEDSVKTMMHLFGVS